jgi:hypothetical protein
VTVRDVDELRSVVFWCADPPPGVGIPDEVIERERRLAAVDARQAEQERIDRETREDERLAALRTHAKLAGLPEVGRELGEILTAALAAGERADRREDRVRQREGWAEVEVPPVPPSRPPELQAVADARAAREARELGEDLQAAGWSKVGGWLASVLGRRP